MSADATEHRAAHPELERMAVASAGQTVFLRSLVELSEFETARLRDEAEHITAKTGVTIVLLGESLEVARITDDA